MIWEGDKSRVPRECTQQRERAHTRHCEHFTAAMVTEHLHNCKYSLRRKSIVIGHDTSSAIVK